MNKPMKLYGYSSHKSEVVVMVLRIRELLILKYLTGSVCLQLLPKHLTESLEQQRHVEKTKKKCIWVRIWGTGENTAKNDESKFVVYWKT